MNPRPGCGEDEFFLSLTAVTLTDPFFFFFFFGERTGSSFLVYVDVITFLFIPFRCISYLPIHFS